MFNIFFRNEHARYNSKRSQIRDVAKMYIENEAKRKEQTKELDDKILLSNQKLQELDTVDGTTKQTIRRVNSSKNQKKTTVNINIQFQIECEDNKIDINKTEAAGIKNSIKEKLSGMNLKTILERPEDLMEDDIQEVSENLSGCLENDVTQTTFLDDSNNRTMLANEESSNGLGGFSILKDTSNNTSTSSTCFDDSALAASDFDDSTSMM